VTPAPERGGLPVDPERLRRQFPALTDEDLAAYGEVTRRVLADPRARGRVLAEVISCAERAAQKQASDGALDPDESTALAYVRALRKMQAR
jgi:hypothetical protein